jgi:hypothetical protein
MQSRSPHSPSSSSPSSPSRRNQSKRKRLGVRNLGPASSTAALGDFASTNGKAVLNGRAETSRPVEVTPNPKPRKVSKRQNHDHSAISPTRATARRSTSQQAHNPIHRKTPSPSKRIPFESPHANNPEADYIPFAISSARTISVSRRHSATPIPAYEYPFERFTPPREVVATPKSLNPGKTTKASKRKEVKLVVKTEPPDVDLTLPLPPPSPSDDPLLLSGPPIQLFGRAGNSRQQNHTNISRGSFHNEETRPRYSVPHSKTPSSHTRLNHKGEVVSHSANVELGNSAEQNVRNDATTPPTPSFDIVGSSNDVWSDSDSDCALDFDQSGEYTGKFTMMSVPVKLDSSASRKSDKFSRCRPVSPFPGDDRTFTTVPDGEEAFDIDGMETEEGDVIDEGRRDVRVLSENGTGHRQAPESTTPSGPRQQFLGGGHALTSHLFHHGASPEENITVHDDALRVASQPDEDVSINPAQETERPPQVTDKTASRRAHSPSSDQDLVTSPCKASAHKRSGLDPFDLGEASASNHSPLNKLDHCILGRSFEESARSQSIEQESLRHAFDRGVISRRSCSVSPAKDSSRSQVTKVMKEMSPSGLSPTPIPQFTPDTESPDQNLGWRESASAHNDEILPGDENRLSGTDSDSEDGDCLDTSLIRISSDDPWAAAQAAAILKQVTVKPHPYLPLLTPGM